MKTPKKEIKQAKMEKDLGLIKIGYYRNGGKGILDLAINAETYTFLDKPLRMKLVNTWISHDLLCIQLTEASDLEGYAVSATNNPTTPHRVAILNVTPELVKHGISPFSRVRAAVLGSFSRETGQKWVIVGIKLDQLRPPIPRGKKKEPEKAPLEASYMMVQALRTLSTEGIPQTNDAVSTLRRAINQLVKPMDLQLSINEDGLLEVSRVTLKRL